MDERIKVTPTCVWDEYRKGTNFKNNLGDKGLAEQSLINNRFFFGDQWHGLAIDKSRPLVRRNIIKRIGEYKISALTAPKLAVNYSADGIPISAEERENKNDKIRELSADSGNMPNMTDNEEINLIMSVLSGYQTVTAERVGLDAKMERAVRNAYITGTAVASTYWNSDIKTGLYSDSGKKTPLTGDIDFEILNINNVVFGDPNNTDVQSQPFIIIAQRRDYADVRREARKNGIAEEIIKTINPDGYTGYIDGSNTLSDTAEQTDSRRVTVLTKFYKEWNESGTDYAVKCVRTTEKATVKEPWDIRIKRYPISVMQWDSNDDCIYGNSEITNIIPNQIAINRVYTACVWSTMISGVPIMVVNGDTVTGEITNDPGQIIKIYGSNEDVAGAVHFVTPPPFSAQMQNIGDGLSEYTLSANGANDAALGDIRPDNAAAIIQMREAALQPMTIYQKKYYNFNEDISRTWMDYWINCYGRRPIKYQNGQDIMYVPFDAGKYKNLVINAIIDVGSSPIYSPSATVATLDAMFSNQMLDLKQYLERLPDGIIPNKQGLINDLNAAISAQNNIPPEADTDITGDTGGIMEEWQRQNPEAYEKFKNLPPEEQAARLEFAKDQMSAQGGAAI